MLETNPEEPSGYDSSDAKARIHPHQVRILGKRCKCNSKSRSERGLQEEDGHDKRLHGRWRFGVSVFQPSDASQDF